MWKTTGQPLLPGNWELIGRGSEITEEQWDDIFNPTRELLMTKDAWVFGEDMIASHNYTPEQVVLLRKII